MKYENPEVDGGVEAEKSQEVAEAVSAMERLRRIEKIARDPEVRRGIEAFLRTVINAGISTADVVPGVGDVASLGADAAKYLAYKLDIKMLDTSPDVSLGVAFGSEAVELMTGGAMPTHVIETTLQARADWPRIRGAYEKTKDIWHGRDKVVHTPEVAAALETFAK